MGMIAFLLPCVLRGSDPGHLFQTQRSNGLLAQHELLHLAAGRQGIGFNKLEVARGLLMTDLLLAEVAQFLLGEFHAFPGPDHRQQFFAKEGVWAQTAIWSPLFSPKAIKPRAT
jgi:hypothetical protein